MTADLGTLMPLGDHIIKATCVENSIASGFSQSALDWATSTLKRSHFRGSGRHGKYRVAEDHAVIQDRTIAFARGQSHRFLTRANRRRILRFKDS